MSWAVKERHGLTSVEPRHAGVFTVQRFRSDLGLYVHLSTFIAGAGPDRRCGALLPNKRVGLVACRRSIRCITAGSAGPERRTGLEHPAGAVVLSGPVLPFESLDILRFRGLRGLRLAGFGRLNILVGGNNCGKTSVLEAFELCCDPLSPMRWISVADRRDIGSNSVDRIDNVFWMFPVDVSSLESLTSSPRSRTISWSRVRTTSNSWRASYKVTLDSVAVVLDADDHVPPVQRHAALRQRLRTVPRPANWPVVGGEVAPGPPRCGIFVLPRWLDAAAIAALPRIQSVQAFVQTLLGLASTATPGGPSPGS